jgi:hypothetical protein
MQGTKNMRRQFVTTRKLLNLGMLLAFLTLAGGCVSTDKIPYLEGRDLVPVKKDQVVKAPVDGWFLSNEFYKFEVEKC